MSLKSALATLEPVDGQSWGDITHHMEGKSDLEAQDHICGTIHRAAQDREICIETSIGNGLIWVVAWKGEVVHAGHFETLAEGLLETYGKVLEGCA